MEIFSSEINKQYYKQNLYDDILCRLEKQGVDLNNVSRSNIAGVDEFHIRGAEVSQELAKQINLINAKVLDVGCGLGGPCRMMADEFNCDVTGIDLCSEFIDTAQKLSKLVGQENNTTFIQADALNLPFEDKTFDVVWTQHVQMNIENKAQFYSEINRVLTENGVLIYYDIFKKGDGGINFPVPWANNSTVSFLANTFTIDTHLVDLDFTKLTTIDQTFKAKEFLNGLFERIKNDGPPKLGLNVLMGEQTKEKLGNIFKGLKEDKLELQSGIYKKTAIAYND